MAQQSGINAIDALAQSSWNRFANTAATLTYSFLLRPPFDSSADDRNGFAALTDVQMQATRDALGQWAAVVNLTFVEVGNNSGAQIQIGTNDQGRVSSGYAYLPRGIADYQVGLYLNNASSTNSNFSAGSYGLTTLLHEIGHTLGLKHPGNYNAGGGTIEPPFLPPETDNSDYTIMSYNDGKSYEIDGQSPATPLLYDIQAIQYLYGANTQWHTGDDSYAFTNFEAPLSIWDAGGVNTFDFSATTLGASIDLHAGAFSETVAGLNNISIAYNVLIQNAIGGSGNDTITGNDDNDTIDGGGGNDTITLGAGSDAVNGGDGTDTVIFAGNFTDFTVLRTAAGLSVQSIAIATSIDTLINVEFLSFNDVRLAADSFGDSVDNSAPTVAHPQGDQYAGYLKPFSFQLASDTFADVDVGDVLHYSATLANGNALPSWLSFDAASLSFSGLPRENDIGNITIRLTATDSRDSAVSSDFHISTVLNFGAAFDATAANDAFVGGDGLDSVSYSGNLADYTVRASGSGFRVTDLTGSQSIDTLKNIDRVRFADGNLALDANGNAGQAYRLYQAAFNRIPDLPGLGYWSSALDSGASLNAVALQFITSQEFIDTYASLSNLEFVQQVYRNVLQREADPGGAEFYQAGIDQGVTTRANVISQFSESAEFQATILATIGDGFAYTPWLG
jgi:hypothetical protein